MNINPDHISDADDAPYPMSEEDVAKLWRNRQQAAYVFVWRDLKRGWGHAFAGYYFPTLGVLLRNGGYYYDHSAWRFPLRPLHPSDLFGCCTIPNADRLRFTDVVRYCGKTGTLSRDKFTTGLWHRLKEGLPIGAWRGVRATPFPDDAAEALAEVCERREFIFT